jgi:uncharacterized protein
MKLTDKLQRLAPPVAASDAARGAVLDELRSKMNALLGVELAPPAARPAPSLDELLLEERTTPRGTYWSRRRALKRSERVGRAGLSEARDVSAEGIALLALDPNLGSLDFSRALYLDTETTGLGGGAGTFAFLIGLGYFEDDALWFEQLFLAGPEQEAAALYRFEELHRRASLLVSFNGKAFDWPLLKGRFVMNRAKVPDDLPHLDLLHVARRVHGERIGKCSLKHVESRVLGFERVGDIDGAEVCSRYGHYLRSGDSSVLGAVIEHNTWDVASMAALVGLYGQALPELVGRDLAGVARTYLRGGALQQAQQMATRAVDSGGGAVALKARAEIHKALGERLSALADYESAERESNDPAVRLELAKLYEHFLKDPARALAVVGQGTSEDELADSRRTARLQRKLHRAPPKPRGGSRVPKVE